MMCERVALAFDHDRGYSDSGMNHPRPLNQSSHGEFLADWLPGEERDRPLKDRTRGE